MTEAQVERYLITCVTERGGMLRKVRWIGRRGCPDRFIMWPTRGYGHWVELKSPIGKLSAPQIREIARLRASGQTVHVLSMRGEVDHYIRENA